MEILTYNPSEQVDSAVDLGALPPPLPGIMSFRQLAAEAPVAPPQIIRGLLHRGCKMVLGGTSKSNKSWSLLDLAISVASGQEWWGHRCEKTKVAYLNFELHPWAMADRVRAIRHVRRECNGQPGMLHFWNLRGHNADITVLRPKLEEELARHQFGLLILDPAYKLLGNRDENANGEIASLMNEFEALARKTGAAIVLAHHFAKGDSTVKNAIDRMSGAGAWARDPDSLLIMTPHEEDDCYAVTSILRNLPQLPEFVLEWDFPLMRLAKDLNPDALRRPQAKSKKCTDREFAEAVLTEEAKPWKEVIRDAELKLEMSRRSVARYLDRGVEAGTIRTSAGLYWVPKEVKNEQA
jgi:hypothetical protein